MPLQSPTRHPLFLEASLCLLTGMTLIAQDIFKVAIIPALQCIPAHEGQTPVSKHNLLLRGNALRPHRRISALKVPQRMSAQDMLALLSLVHIACLALGAPSAKLMPIARGFASPTAR